MDSEYAQLYRSLHERHWWWRAREAMILDQLRRLRPAGGFGPILDVGCGDGLLLERLEGFGEPEGLEPDAAIVSAASRERWRFHLCPFDDGFDPGRRFGLILMLDVLEHLPDDRAALIRAAQLLEPEGILLVTVPAFRLLWTTHDDLNFHRTRYTRSELLKVLRLAGFRVRWAHYFFHWLFPVKLMVRAKERIRGSEPGPPGLPPPVVNRTFYALSRLEQRSWGRLRPPLGSSILALAEPAVPT